VSTPLSALRGAVDAAAVSVSPAGRPHGRPPTLERPPRVDFGDYSTNVALLLAPTLGEPPRQVAQRIGAALAQGLGDTLERVEVAGPGFLNLFLSDAWFHSALAHILHAGAEHGGGGADPVTRIDIEFVSANPTGPLTVASGRHAAFGDALARILAFHGHHVHREYYVNDFGSQVRRLGESIRARARGDELPPDGYAGDYVADLVDPALAAEADVAELSGAGVKACLSWIEHTLKAFRVHFDEWFSEASLHVPPGPAGTDPVSRAIGVLEGKDVVYDSQGARWLRTSDAGDDKDRVLERSSGERTYFASDIAHHQYRLARGYDLLIDVWGADHHGYVRRMQAAFAALGGAPQALEVVILQFVHLMTRGERASMSKRRGEFVTLDDLMAEIGVDAARFFLIARSADTTVDLDLDLARQSSAENPVYYVQYAHARIASMLARAGEERVAQALVGLTGAAPAADGPPPALEAAERTLIKKLAGFSVEVAEAAARRAPHRIAAYALELAQEFTAFYRDCRVLGAEPAAVESRRIGLSRATQHTIARSLDLLGVHAPESM